MIKNSVSINQIKTYHCELTYINHVLKCALQFQWMTSHNQLRIFINLWSLYSSIQLCEVKLINSHNHHLLIIITFVFVWSSVLLIAQSLIVLSSHLSWLSHNSLKITDSEKKSSSIKTILYLCLQRDETITALNLEDSKLYQDKVTSSLKPTDISLNETFENPFTSHLLSHNMSHNSVSQKITSGLYTICLWVFRLDFNLINLIKSLSAQGFMFEFRPDFNVKLPYYVNKLKVKNCNYFWIYYNFNSDALLITAIDKI